MSGRSPQVGRRAFTLVELLVVIGIITVLIGLLMPTMRKARRHATVLVSPVAYIGTDSVVHQTDPSGGFDITMPGQTKQTCPVCHTPPVWSPSGQSLAYRMVEGTKGYTAITDPMSGRTKKFAENGTTGNVFTTWVDSQRYVSSDRGTYYVNNADTGIAQTRFKPKTLKDQFLFAFPAPPSAPGPYIGMVYSGNKHTVCFLRKDLTAGRIIWREPATTAVGSNEFPRIDPSAEWVAWSQKRSTTTDKFWIALKAVRQPSDVPPTILGQEYISAYFCDFTEDGSLLCNVSRDGSRYALVVMDRSGRVIRELHTAVPPNPGIVASWRKYGHR